MKTKHTPGKWKQDGLYIDAEDKTLIATVHSENSIENEANGKLIAAAPELLEALIRFVKFADAQNLEYESAMVREAKAAVKKATQ